jgi:hypothetical protein
MLERFRLADRFAHPEIDFSVAYQTVSPNESDIE